MMDGVVLELFDGFLYRTHTLQQLDSHSQLLQDSLYFYICEVWGGQGDHVYSLAQLQARSVSLWLARI
jgi:hypothetical protein